MEQICVGCQRTVSGGELLFTTSGEVMCPQCLQLQELYELDVKAGKNIVNAAISCLGLALVSWFINPFLLATVSSISSGLYAIKSLQPDNERFWKHVKSQRPLIMILSCVGIVLTLAGISLRMLGMANLRVL